MDAVIDKTGAGCINYGPISRPMITGGDIPMLCAVSNTCTTFSVETFISRFCLQYA